MLKENLKDGVITGIVLSFVIGVIISWILKPTFSSVVLILSLALLPGFFIISLLYVYRLGREKIKRTTRSQKFDFGVEINLRRLQIVHNKYSSMIQTAGIIATGSFLAMIFLVRDFPNWTTGHQIFFPIATVLFIFTLHFAFRWWFVMREDYQHLQFQKLKE
ncbi:hypothetical protein CL621_00345 [archaeon]|nr:hypothetical protein [archaeon]|tara:strand:+ start:334 stop:819 length:486 start_codon:yes stop_codon:yes gene_type:complete